MQIYKAHIIDTPTMSAFRIVENGYIGVGDDGRVTGLWHSLPEALLRQTQDPASGVTLTDWGDRLLIPAFCDMHVHAPQYRNLGLAMNRELLEWLNEYTFPEEARYADPAYAQRIYTRFVHELWMQGTMRSSVFATIHEQATDLLVDLLLKAGLSAYVGLVGMDRNSPDNLLNSARRVEAYYATHQDHDRVHPILTPRFVPACSPEMLSAFGRLVAAMGMPVQSHLSVNRAEIDWVRQLEPQASCYADAYRRYGLLGQTPTLMAHCCYTQGTELDMLLQHHVTVVHCPTSNSNLASGIAPVRTFLDAGIPVTLGTDVSAGHYMSMLRVMQYAVQVSKLHYARSEGKIPYLSLSEAFYLATKAGGDFFGQAGCFDTGNWFDALLVDDSYLNYDQYTMEQRLQRFIYIGDDRDIRKRFSCGKELVEPPLTL